MAKDNDNQPYLQNQALFESSCEHPTIAFMPDQIEYQSLSHKEIQKRHLAWAEMPLKCFDFHMTGNCMANIRINLIPARKQRTIRT